MKPRLLFYCQHVLGMGHLVRSRELVRAMTGFDVRFVNGGEPVDGFEFPAHAAIEQLPPIAADTEFRGIDATSQTFAERRRMLQALIEQFQPDVLMIEMFPFGRRKFAEELLPLLDANRRRVQPGRVVCSVRDILVSKRDQHRHEEFACRTLNEYFDLVLVHSDPAFQQLGESFGRMGDLRVQVEHTGFVTEPAPKRVARVLKDKPRLIASVGGGRVGFELLVAVIGASRALDLPHSLTVFTGPHCPEQEFQALCIQSSGAPSIRVERFATDFVSQMAEADLSISMAGYNTCMNIVATGQKALVLPFAGNGNEEQAVRAQKLERMGILNVLRSEDLVPARLAGLIKSALSTASRPAATLDLHGAGNSVLAVERCLGAIHA